LELANVFTKDHIGAANTGLTAVEKMNSIVLHQKNQFTLYRARRRKRESL